MMSDREYRYVHRTRDQLYRMRNAIRILQNEQRDKRVKRRAIQRHINRIKEYVRLLQKNRMLQRVQELREELQ